MFKDYAKLHFIVLIWGFTGILGAAISVPAVHVVVWRTLVAFIGLFVLIRWQGTVIFPGWPVVRNLVLTGFLVGIHWMTFFAAVKIGGASLGMIGLSTSTLWVALMAPFFLKKKISTLEIILGILVVLMLSFIAHAEFSRILGLTLSIVAAFFASIFSYFNGRFSKYVNHNVIAFYEMVGAFIVSLGFVIFSQDSNSLFVLPSLKDAALIACLALFCTVYPYAASVELLKRLSVFTVNLSVNLEPVYGIILAAIFLKEHVVLNSNFYIGSLALIGIVISYPVVVRRQARRAAKNTLVREIL
jgi:drug/metabolite transporter (DMT)-like permease